MKQRGLWCGGRVSRIRARLWSMTVSRAISIQERCSSCVGVMKFNAMLAWLQSQLAVPAASPKAAEQKPLQAPEPERGEQTEEINPSPVEDAPDAVPAEGVSAKLPVVPESEAAEPEPEAEAEPMETGQEAEETARSHEEL